MRVPPTLRSRLPIAAGGLGGARGGRGNVATNSSTPTNHARDTANAASDSPRRSEARSPEGPGSSDPPANRSSASATDPPATASAPATAPTLLATPPPRGRPVSVSVAGRPTGPAVPTDFLGLSFEVRSLPTIATYAGKGDLATLLRSLGPGVMRFGGISADEQAAWVPAGASKPAWASTAIEEQDLAGIGVLAKETGWKVLLTVNLGHYEPQAAAQEAAVAHSAAGLLPGGDRDRQRAGPLPPQALTPPGDGREGVPAPSG